MKNWILVTIILTTLTVISCGKKDEGAPPPVGCGPQTVASPYFGGCIVRDRCPQGTVRNPNELSMCADPNTGNNIMPQQCGAGFILTTSGCYQQGPCAPGQALVGDSCKNAVGGGAFPQQQVYGGAGGWGATGMYGGGSPYGAYQQNQYGMYPRYY